MDITKQSIVAGNIAGTRPIALSLTLACALFIGACSSDDKDSALPDVIVNDDIPVSDDVASGRLDEGSESAQLRFEIEEDGILDGYFHSFETVEVDRPSSEPVQGDFYSAFTILSLPQNGQLTLRSEGTIFHYEPEADFFGSDSFLYADGDGVDIQVIIDVLTVPDAPVLNPDFETVVAQGTLYSVILEATDADGDEIFFTADNLPDWLNLDAGTGVLSGVARQSDAGDVFEISLTATDATGLSDTIENIELSVVDINDPPSLNTTQVPRVLHGRENVTFSVFPDDLDDDQVTVSVDPSHAFESMVSGRNIELLVNDIEKAELIPLTIIARDERGAVTREVIPVQLYPRTASGKGITVSGYRDGRGINVVILGDGYASDQQHVFRQHVQDILSNIRSDEGIAAHLGAFNIHMIETISRQSGADDSDKKDTVDTAFDSAYNCKSVPRLVCAHVFKLFQATVPEYPSVEQIILLVNDPRFGGSGNSGGRVAITSGFFPEIALHEMGHSLANLADEYVDPVILETVGTPAFQEGRYKNVSTLSDPSKVPWAHWIDPTRPLPQFAADEGVGVFQGGLYLSTGVYRGTFDSRMRSYNQPFGPVNTEQWVLRLYTLTDGVRRIAPEGQVQTVTAGEFIGFSVDPVFDPSVQEILWSLNDEPLLPTGASASFVFAGVPADAFEDEAGSLDDAIELVGGRAIEALATGSLDRLALSLPAGQHLLTLTVSDISGRIRVDPPHAGIVTRQWTINVL